MNFNWKSVGQILPIFLLICSALIWLFFLHHTSELNASADTLLRMQKLENQTAEMGQRLNKLSPDRTSGTSRNQEAGHGAAAPSAGAGTETDLKEERDLLESELKLTEQQIAEAQDTEKRTREAATAFLGVFAILAAIVLGYGYLNIFEFNKKRDELETGLKKKEGELDEKLKKTESLHENYQKEVKEFAAHREILEEISKTWKTVSGTGLDVFLVEARKVLDKEENLELSEQLAVMEELDAYTYLYPLSRFGDKKPEEIRQYIDSQIQSMRGLIAKKNYHQTLRRVKHLVDSKSLCLSGESLGRVQAYEAYAYYFLIQRMLIEPSWARQTKHDEIVDLCAKANKALINAEANAPKWLFGIFVRAQFYSILPKVAIAFDKIPRGSLPSGGRREAVKEYKRLLEDREFRNRHAVLQNLACELKFIAEETGAAADWQEFTSVLESYPDDQVLKGEFDECKRRDQSRPQLLYVWQSILMDSDLFKSLNTKVDHKKARDFWIALLNKKVKTGKWREALTEIHERVPAAKEWDLNLLKSS